VERLDLAWYWYMYFNAKEERLDLTWYWYMYFNEKWRG
jgi:hypothetical protein